MVLNGVCVHVCICYWRSTCTAVISNYVCSDHVLVALSVMASRCHAVGPNQLYFTTIIIVRVCKLLYIGILTIINNIKLTIPGYIRVMI